MRNKGKEFVNTFFSIFPKLNPLNPFSTRNAEIPLGPNNIKNRRRRIKMKSNHSLVLLSNTIIATHSTLTCIESSHSPHFSFFIPSAPVLAIMT
jgi:hypothetical protein